MSNNLIAKIKQFIFFPIATLLAGELIGLISYIAFPFNPHDHKFNYPSIYPPISVFIVVWIILYPCMGMAMAYIYNLRKQQDINGVLIAYVIMLSANLMFVPIMDVSMGNPGVLTIMDLNGIISALCFSWLCRKYSKQAFYWSLPLSIWMPITFFIKVAFWMAN